VYCYALKNSGSLQAGSRSTVLFVVILLTQLLVLKLHVLSEVTSMMHDFLGGMLCPIYSTWKLGSSVHGYAGGLHTQHCSSCIVKFFNVFV
jgi:hypothetical protein